MIIADTEEAGTFGLDNTDESSTTEELTEDQITLIENEIAENPEKGWLCRYLGSI